MKRISRIIASLCLTSALAVEAVGCSGGGRTAVIGFGNRDNNLGGGAIAEQLAEALAESEGQPEVTNEMIAEIFGAILKHAREGNPEAALIVLKIAEEQREAEES